MLDVRKIRLILELRELGISNAEVLSAIEKIPREKFISETYRNQAYENIVFYDQDFYHTSRFNIPPPKSCVDPFSLYSLCLYLNFSFNTF